jgi:hypothetical protein
MNRADRMYSIGKNMLFFLIANHIGSAIDAFISARAYNDRLLNQASVWQRVTIDHQVAYSLDEGFQSRLGVRVRF